MKKIILLILLSVLSIFLFSNTNTVHAYVDLDVINEYDIEISENKDGTLNMKYHINWTVLNDSVEGPLTWVKIGIPNRHASNIKNESSKVIKDVSYYSDDGSFIKVTFHKKYYASDTVDFTFSFIQSRIYTLNGNYVEYRFNPGYFPYMKVTNYTVKWISDKPLYSNADSINNNEYLWTGSFDYNETINVDMRYDASHFDPLKKNKQYISYEDEAGITTVIIIAGVLLTFGLIVYFASRNSFNNSDGYYAYTGFSGYHYYRFYYLRPRRYNGVNSKGSRIVPPTISNGSSSGSSHHSSCACACACACAGGGRAGCSRKDFYHTYPDVDKIIEILEK